MEKKTHENKCFSKSGLGTVVFLSDSLVTGTFVTWVGDRLVFWFIYFLFTIIYKIYIFLTFCCIFYLFIVHWSISVFSWLCEGNIDMILETFLLLLKYPSFRYSILLLPQTQTFNHKLQKY